QNRINEKVETNAIAPAFQRITIDTVFRSESVTAADIDQDGALDIVVGDVWYAAPDWQIHEIRTPGAFLNTVFQEDKPASEFDYYSNSFAVQSMDVNQDGWPDVIVYPVMNQPIFWYENPKGENRHWQERKIVEAYHGESPRLVDLLNNGKMGALAGVNTDDSLYHLGWIQPGDHLDSLWQVFTIGSTKQLAIRGPEWDTKSKWFAPGARDHGLGFGDLNGDGRNDVLTSRGWYEAPVNTNEENWKLHYLALDSLADPEYPQYIFAQMPIFDIDQDGDGDFVGTSAHRYGLWWFEQKSSNTFSKHEIPIQMSQVHSVALGDANNNGVPDIITGKRYLAHNGNDPGWDEPLRIIWMEPELDSVGQVSFLIKEIDVGVGVGTQIEITDINEDGKEDLLTSNKKGTYLFLQIDQAD
ncbi:MAG: VCBS repeat-containing protein, partial [Cyclobacteriaceae bacterium]|nr:VCBS repeat-containing protein [Cyclobacteriaceae bacterium]